jgi:hypothetical protein
MLLGQYNNWNAQSNTATGALKDSHIVADPLPSDYTDISSIENWHQFGPGLIGSAFGFKDWKCLQREIKSIANDIVGNDYDANWGNLNPAEQNIVCNYVLGAIPPIRFAEAIPDPDERMQISIDFDLNNRRARGNWQTGQGRIQIMRIFLFGKIGKANALEVFRDVIRDDLLELYEGGIEGTEEDGIPGIADFILTRSGTPYVSSGLIKRDYPVIDDSGYSMEDIANVLIGIASYGLY